MAHFVLIFIKKYDKINAEVNDMSLKELRKQKGLTQKKASEILDIPLRTYIRFELDEKKINTLKYNYIVEKLQQVNLLDENNGVLKLDEIKSICNEVFENYKINYCYLFGSYAKNKAKKTSDIDLFVSSNLSGLKYFEMVEVLREKLKKKVDVLNQKQLENNPVLVEEILSEGIKIYG